MWKIDRLLPYWSYKSLHDKSFLVILSVLPIMFFLVGMASLWDAAVLSDIEIMSYVNLCQGINKVMGIVYPSAIMAIAYYSFFSESVCGAAEISYTLPYGKATIDCTRLCTDMLCIIVTVMASFLCLSLVTVIFPVLYNGTCVLRLDCTNEVLRFWLRLLEGSLLVYLTNASLHLLVPNAPFLPLIIGVIGVLFSKSLPVSINVYDCMARAISLYSTVWSWTDLTFAILPFVLLSALAYVRLGRKIYEIISLCRPAGYNCGPACLCSILRYYGLEYYQALNGFSVGDWLLFRL